MSSNSSKNKQSLVLNPIPVPTSPERGELYYDKLDDSLKYYNGASWIPTGAVAGSGLTGGGNSALTVSVDNSTIEIASNLLQLKALGVTAAKMADLTITGGKVAANTLTPNKLAISGSFQVASRTSTNWIDPTAYTQVGFRDDSSSPLYGFKTGSCPIIILRKNGLDCAIAHKTGTLSGYAQIDCRLFGAASFSVGTDGDDTNGIDLVLFVYDGHFWVVTAVYAQGVAQ
jgi:hypothetical protein